jgi:hypothetical protein
MPCHAMHPMQGLFLESFSYELQLDMHSYLQKKNLFLQKVGVTDILNQKRPVPKIDMVVFAERCSAAILDGLPDNMGDPGVPTFSCMIGTQKFGQALCDIRASVSIVPKIIYDQLNHDFLVPTSMHL